MLGIKGYKGADRADNKGWSSSVGAQGNGRPGNLDAQSGNGGRNN